MIRNILVPEHINDLYLIKTTIIGVTITKQHVYTTQAIATNKKRVIKTQSVSSIAEKTDTKDHQEQTVEALKNAFANLSYDQVVSTIPSSMAVFKRLSVPFSNPEQIKMIVNFEVEPLLPFALKDAVIDFIITRVGTKDLDTEILVAAVRKDHIAQHLALFEQAGIAINTLTIDFFALYGLFNEITAYKKDATNAVLLDIAYDATRIAHIKNGDLIMLRTLPRGITHVVQETAKKSSLEESTILDHLLRFGFQNNEQPFTRILTEEFLKLINEIQFTISSMTTGANETKQPPSILLLGNALKINGISQFIGDHSSLSCTIFEVNKIIQDGNVSFVETIGTQYASIFSLAAALPTIITQTFNLRTGEFSFFDNSLLLKQLILSCFLLISITGLTTIHYYRETNKLIHAKEQSKNEIFRALQERFPEIEESYLLSDIIEEAEDAVTEEETTWFAFSAPARSSILQILLELKSRIDKDAIGFVLEKLAITDNNLTIKARVRDFNGLKLLEKSLDESPLFSFVPPQNEESFEMTITLASNHKD